MFDSDFQFDFYYLTSTATDENVKLAYLLLQYALVIPNLCERRYKMNTITNLNVDTLIMSNRLQ